MMKHMSELSHFHMQGCLHLQKALARFSQADDITYGAKISKYKVVLGEAMSRPRPLFPQTRSSAESGRIHT